MNQDATNLASGLSDPDGLAEGVEVVLRVVDHTLSAGSVVVNGDGVDGATLAGVDEVLHPLLSVRAVGASRGDQSVATVLQGLDVLLPEAGSVPRVDVSLGLLVGPEEDLLAHTEGKTKGGYDVLVHAQSVFGVVVRTVDDVLYPRIDVLVTPKHRSAVEAEALGTLGTPGTPGVDAKIGNKNR